MSITTKAAIIAVAMALLATAARSDGLGNYGILGQPNSGGIGGAFTAAAAPVGCASPTAPNGVVDLSQCSNAYYVALIF